MVFQRPPSHGMKSSQSNGPGQITLCPERELFDFRWRSDFDAAIMTFDAAILTFDDRFETSSQNIIVFFRCAHPLTVDKPFCPLSSDLNATLKVLLLIPLAVFARDEVRPLLGSLSVSILCTKSFVAHPFNQWALVCVSQSKLQSRREQLRKHWKAFR